MKTSDLLRIQRHSEWASLAPFDSPISGVVASLEPLRMLPDSPPIWVVAAQFADVSESPPRKRHGVGAGVSLDEGITAALAEAIERYSLFVRSVPAVRVCTCADLPPNTVDLMANLQPYEEWQYDSRRVPFHRFDRDERYHWVRALSFGEEQSWLPAGLAFPSGRSPFPVFREINSNGLALGLTLQEAMSSALLEVMERDAVLATWYLGLPTTQLDLTLASTREGSPLAFARGYERFLRLYALRAGWPVHVILALVVQPGRKEAVVGIGAAASTDFLIACKKSILEAFQVRHSFMSEYDPDRSAVLARDWDLIRQPVDRLLVYQDDELRPRLLDFLTSRVAEVMSVEDGNGSQESSLSQSIRRELDPLFVEVTPADVAQAGLHVVRADVPGSIPLHIDQRFIPLAAIQRCANALGVERPPMEQLLPHPFA